jgi:hypothetical protein
MIDISDPQTFWVNMTNVVLGLVTLCCAVLLGSVVINELLERWVGRVLGGVATDPHAIGVQGLGMTMADGGEKIGGEEAGGVDYWGF